MSKRTDKQVWGYVGLIVAVAVVFGVSVYVTHLSPGDQLRQSERRPAQEAREERKGLFEGSLELFDVKAFEQTIVFNMDDCLEKIISEENERYIGCVIEFGPPFGSLLLVDTISSVAVVEKTDRSRPEFFPTTQKLEYPEAYGGRNGNLVIPRAILGTNLFFHEGENTSKFDDFVDLQLTDYKGNVREESIRIKKITISIDWNWRNFLLRDADMTLDKDDRSQILLRFYLDDALFPTLDDFYFVTNHNKDRGRGNLKRILTHFVPLNWWHFSKSPDIGRKLWIITLKGLIQQPR